MKRNIMPALLSAALLLTMSGCQSVPNPADIPTEMTVPELNQSAQTAFDKSNYRAAAVYYQTVIDRFGSDLAVLTAAEFELAHLKMKKKAWSDARTRLETIIARYESTGGAGLPPEYLVLAKNDLERIPVTAKK